MEYPGVVLVLGLKISVGCNSILWNFYSEVLFCLEFPGLKEKPKNSRWFSKRFVLKSPFSQFDFFLEYSIVILAQ